MLSHKTDRKNRVDILKEEILTIQSTCVHIFYKIKDCKLKDSLVAKTYITVSDLFIICCDFCSLEISHYASSVCPNCLTVLTKEEGLRKREKYFGVEFLYYAVRLSYCLNCNFSIINEEWDQ